MPDSLRSAAPASAVGGFAGRPPGQWPDHPAPRREPDAPRPEASVSVSVGTSAAVARRLLRERVLARTRALLEVDDAAHGPEFAEVVDEESMAAFLGRLLSAQNQLAARRAGSWEPARIRGCLDAGMRAGIEETLELIAADGRSDAQATAVVAEIVAEYGRRLAALADGEPSSPAS